MDGSSTTLASVLSAGVPARCGAAVASSGCVGAVARVRYIDYRRTTRRGINLPTRCGLRRPERNVHRGGRRRRSVDCRPARQILCLRISSQAAAMRGGPPPWPWPLPPLLPPPLLLLLLLLPLLLPGPRPPPPPPHRRRAKRRRAPILSSTSSCHEHSSWSVISSSISSVVSSRTFSISSRSIFSMFSNHSSRSRSRSAPSLARGSPRHRSSRVLGPRQTATAVILSLLLLLPQPAHAL